ncbi:MAG: DUF262 domain-containing protein, partial [Asgard group archaeon]|nr:DUF262 domain-containing protein [Asgard group archaeon]
MINRTKQQTWPITLFQTLKSVIDTSPKYQRTEVWGKEKKQMLIDSILRGFDISQIYLAETREDSKYEYEVVDGQQRLSAIWGFFEDKLLIGEKAKE